MCEVVDTPGRVANLNKRIILIGCRVIRSEQVYTRYRRREDLKCQQKKFVSELKLMITEF